LLVIDIDNFKSVNDIYGHHAGDELLTACALVMAQTSAKFGFAARIGGEEFCIVLENININDAQTIAERVRYRINQTTVDVLGVHVQRSASIGVANLATNSHLQDAISLADEALYQSKAKGKNCTTLADDLFIEQWKKNNSSPKLDAILTGIENGEFEFYIQPICNNQTHKAVGFETLMRWHRADGSVLTPSSFLDIALSPPVYLKFKDASLAQLAPILAELMSRNPDYYLSFNMDSTFIHSTVCVDNLINQFYLSQTKLNRLVLELSETAVIYEKELVAKNVELLRQNGFAIALDDFGMEHSNMDRIRDIPADFVKIDRSFIQQMEGNPRSLAIIKALVNMSKELNFKIIGEGIETPAQAELLAAAGVTRVQGYYYGRPKPVSYWLDQIDKKLI
jgi:diguanylate cyclase (GGDEF)-like protein